MLLAGVLMFDVWFLSVSCLAGDITFEVTIDRTRIPMGSTANLNLSFYGTQDVSAPELPDIEGLDCRYVGPSTKISIVNGQVSNSITHVYRIIPLRTGVLRIPPFSLGYKGGVYTSDAITLEVIQGSASVPQSGQTSGPKEEASLEDRVFIIMEAVKTEAYVNELIPVKIKFYINELTIRDIQYPEFAHEGFSVDEYEEPKKHYSILESGAYDIYEFGTNIFAMRPGELTIGPASLSCNLLVKKQSRRRSFFNDDFFSSFFDRYEKYPLTVTSLDIPITILELPAEGVPDGFSGALGDYNFYMSAEPKKVKVGDPITLKMTISGGGSPHTLKPPVIDFGEDFKVYEPEIKQADGVKTFEYVVIPKSDKVSYIPVVTFSYFDTDRGRYRTISRGPIQINVDPLPPGEELKVFEMSEKGTALFRRRETLGTDIIYIKDSPGRLRKTGGFLCRNKVFLVLQVLPLLAVVSVLVFQKRKERLQTDVRYARRIRAPRKAKANLLNTRKLLDGGEKDRFFESVFKTLQEYLGDRFHLPTAGITSNVVEELRSRNIKSGLLDKIGECFANCDMARYAPSSVTKEQMAWTFRLLQEIIDGIERGRV